MNRQIKFRGKRLNEKKEWVIGYLWINETNGDHFIVTPDDSKGGWLLANVDPETAGQYTGQADKHAISIFEGDIVGLHFPANRRDDPNATYLDHKSLRVIRWYGNRYNYVGFNVYPPRSRNGGKPQNRYEVLGNIYDNPELVEEIKALEALKVRDE